jgi:hypothetical protein
MKETIDELETDFEKGYQPRTDIEKDENVCLQILTIV